MRVITNKQELIERLAEEIDMSNDESWPYIDLTAHFPEGTWTGIVGANGAGKTTLKPSGASSNLQFVTVGN